MRILLVEDEPHAAHMLAKGLREAAYAVDVVGDGERALYEAGLTNYDAIILDVMLPVRDGLSVCRELRRGGSAVPILMLTARDAVEARIAGLDLGADDYVTKPFDFRELLARLRAAIRRGSRPLTPSVLTIGPLHVDTRARRAFRNGQQVLLTTREYALLEYLALHAGAVVGREAIAEHVWDSNYNALSNVIDVFIQRLRRRIDLPGQPSLIETRRGEGYMLAAPASQASKPA